jgi:hypothetical protein
VIDIDLDLGDGHTLRWVSFAPDRSIAKNAETYANVPDDPRCGAIVTHTTDKTETGLCEGYIGLNPAVNTTRATWQVESWEPLTLSPSLLCSCGDHGFIRGGKWVRA